jgi:hypothetical protein
MPFRPRRVAIASALLVSFVSLNGARAEGWKEPADGLFTERQLTSYAAAQKEVFQMLKAMGKAMEGSKSGMGTLTMLAGMDDKVNAILTKHGLQRAEYDWLIGETAKCLGVAMMDTMSEQSKTDLAGQKKKNADDVAAAKAKIAAYEKAQKDGTRVLTKEQRDEAIKSATEAKTAAADEVKQYAGEAKSAAEEATKADAEAKAADALAKKPPADVTADAREDYVAARKEEAESSRSTAKSAREREAEARKSQAEAQARADAAAKTVARPEAPVTDDDKAQVRKENEEALAATQAELDTLIGAGQLLADSDGQWQKQRDELHKDVKEPNLALVKKHLPQIQDVWGMTPAK